MIKPHLLTQNPVQENAHTHSFSLLKKNVDLCPMLYWHTFPLNVLLAWWRKAVICVSVRPSDCVTDGQKQVQSVFKSEECGETQ